MTFKEHDVLWRSDGGNVVVVFNYFDMGCKYKVCRKVTRMPSGHTSWEYVIAFGTMGEAVGYAKKIYDEEVFR